MERIDTTPTHRKVRTIRFVNGRRVKTRIWFDDSGADIGIPPKSETYEKINLEYYQKKAVNLKSYQITLRPWTEESPSPKSLNT